MSYDFSMYLKTERSKVYTRLSYNYTYNVSPIFSKALKGESIATIHGMRGDEALQMLADGVNDMYANMDEYRRMNPKNGWGDSNGALHILEALVRYAKEFPDGIFEVN